MAEGFHSKQTQDTGLHSGFVWVWADAAARAAQTGVTQHHVDTYCFGLQVDTKAFYRPTATTPTWEQIGGAGGGNVSGPASSTDNAIARFNGTTGQAIQNSTAVIADDGNMTVEVRDAVNNDISVGLTVRHNVSNTAQDGIGVAIEMQAERQAGESIPAAQIQAVFYDESDDQAKITLLVREDGGFDEVFEANAQVGNSYVEVGARASAQGNQRSALGPDSNSEADFSSAIGADARTRIEKTTNVAGPIIVRKDDGAFGGDAFRFLGGAEVVIFSAEVNLETVADETITLPSGCHFWIDEVGVICTSLSGLVTQPTIRFGITGTLAKHRAATITTLLTAAFKREKHAPLVPQDGETSLTAGVTVAADATTMLGRFYWKGILVEDE